MVASGPPPPAQPRTQPYGPRRRAWLLVAITVVALAPLGIGFGLGQVAGGGHPASGGHRATTTVAVPALPGHPPVATVGSGGAQVKAVLGSYCWSSGGATACRDAATDTPRDEPVLRVSRGAAVTVAFAVGASPTAVSVGPAQGAGASHSLVPGNPTRLRFTAAPGSYPVVIATTWPGRLRRQASYLVRVEVG